MKKQMTKLGARTLSDQEMELILPNSKSIYEQINVFRNNIPDNNSKQQEYEQKTNNIGIMGCRGAGKTSILRTIHKHLIVNKEKSQRNEDDSLRDVILPIIIPENMSLGSTLMDIVLGMLKAEVDKRKAQKQVERGECIYAGREPLEKSYNELVKQYCYIKKDYRDILIQQFTTEQYYVDKTKEVFNSDTEFIKQFNSFINQMLNDKKSMLFLFIDDIDLSTTRCMDVVKTLLSYLSHPRIVTFISGDIQTFEEALTLDFLRQEKALDKNVYDKTFYSTLEEERSILLKRKKTLAYEYLKKIIPPAYRWSIKRWSLEERGLYQVTEGDKEQKNFLSKLLVEITKEQLGEAYFVYKDGNEDKEEKKILSVTFHMFDDTSRGLNNVYNVLQELYAEKMDQTKKVDHLKMWRLIETIIDSKPLYAQYKDLLLEKIIVREQETVKVHFDNALNWLYFEQENKNISTNENEFSSQECFIIFLLIDFSAKLFLQADSNDDNYSKLKNNVIEDYINDETIDEKISSSGHKISFKELIDKEKRTILLDFLTQGDFIFDLYLIKYLGRKDIYRILEETPKEPEDIYKIAYAFVGVIWAWQENDKNQRDYLADLYLYMKDPIESLLDKLPLKADVIFGQQLVENKINFVSKLNYIDKRKNLAYGYRLLVDRFCEKVEDKYDQSNLKINLMLASYYKDNILYWIYYEGYIREDSNKEIDLGEMAQNLISRGLKRTLMNQMKANFTSYRVKKLNESTYLISTKEERVISEIDKKDLWNNLYVQNQVFPHIKKTKNDYIIDMTKGRCIFDATEIFGEYGVYGQFENCYKGSSGRSLANVLLEKVKEVLLFHFSNSPLTDPKELYIDGRYYMRLEHVLLLQCLLEGFLSKHPRIQYAKKEIRKLLMGIRELPLVVRFLNHVDTSENITTDDGILAWYKLQKQLLNRDNIFFQKVRDRFNLFFDYGLKNKKQLESEPDYYKLKDIIQQFPNSLNRYENLSEIIRMLENLGQSNSLNEKERLYFCYVQLYLQVATLERKYCLQKIEESDLEKLWRKFEPFTPKNECIFYLHSYLRYLQSNDTVFAEAGIRAEKIELLIEDILDSQKLADDQIYSSAYELLGEELGLTEEEFENLFTKKE